MQKALLIDDDPLLLERMQTALQRQGFEVLTAANGEGGLNLARAHLPAIIICDVNMEPVDGYTALQSLRHEPATNTIPFILMTGEADQPGLRKGMDLGADDYLAKPFTMEALLASVEARLRKARSFKTSSERRLDELHASISSIVPHELNTPLTSILEFSDILRTRFDTLKRDDVLEMLGHIHGAGQRLHRLIEHNLLWSRLLCYAADPRRGEELGGRHTDQPHELIKPAAERCAAAHQRNLELNLASNPGAILTAPEYLPKIVEELLDNAFKFSTPDSKVHLRTSTVQGDFVLSVMDAGRGMNPEQIARIRAFVQFERALHEQQGTGLGLALVKKAVELQGGTFSIRSQVWHGTIVTVSFPYLERPRPAAPSSGRPSNSMAGRSVSPAPAVAPEPGI